MRTSKLLSYIHGRSCAILGLGVSNLPLAQVLCDAGIPLTVYDKKSVGALGDAAQDLAARGVRFVCGADAFAEIGEALIFRSPGIRPDLSGLVRAQARGSELCSEIELLLLLGEAETFGITGSDGKTTTTTLTGKFLETQKAREGIGRVFVGGNIGTPLLTRCDDMTEDDCAVLELSSFQLMTADACVRHAAITNLTPNHLDWHTDMDEYERAKRHIVGKETVRFVTNAENAVTARIAREEIARAAREVILFSSTRTQYEDFSDFATDGKPFGAIYERDGVIRYSDGHSEQILLKTEHIRVPGRHNVENFMTAMGLTLGEVDVSVYESVAKEFSGVEHRLEWVRTLDGVDYYNGSIDSSPTRTAAALSALQGRDIVVICGGYDKKIAFEPLAESLCHAARAVVLTGATGEKIRACIEACAQYDRENLQIVSEPIFADAVAAARALARDGGCVLLSPACASFDAFRNFAERGNAFKTIVKSFSSAKDTKN